MWSKASENSITCTLHRHNVVCSTTVGSLWLVCSYYFIKTLKTVNIFEIHQVFYKYFLIWNIIALLKAFFRRFSVIFRGLWHLPKVRKVSGNIKKIPGRFRKFLQALLTKYVWSPVFNNLFRNHNMYSIFRKLTFL